MPDHTITYFPVGNGDTILITLADKTTFVIDLNVTEASSDKDDPSRYDVHGHLLREARSDGAGYQHHDAFLNSHPDQDHIRGYRTVFYAGDPTKYTDKDKRAGRIIADELWFAPRIFWPWAESDLCDDAKAFKKEVDRRIVLYRVGSEARNLPGNRIRIVGYTDNPELKGLEGLVIVPGNAINLVNGSIKKDFAFFVHAPVRKDTDAEWQKRNDTSVVLQARFAVDGVENAALAFFGGDAGCAIWEAIIDKSRDATLDWDLFLAPHHCSWTFFSELPSEENKPSEKIRAFLKKHKRKGAFVIASSKPIKDDDDDPPHYQAAVLYRKEVGDDHFICTCEHPDAKKPLPIYFRMTKNGPQKDEYSKGSQVVSSAALAATVTTPKTYGWRA
ncbi:MAG TPA: hypothetical protein VGV13_07780 [Methylomirabilota bacterium]|jgi:hypothetical protein|nr:hypothetical protein [Methylomirabilota bacterium]